MKIAYLIAAAGDYVHLHRLVTALNDAGVHFFIHIDAKSPMPDNMADFNNITFVRRIKVWWGGWSQVEATLIMMREALKGGFDYYAFISGGDYPVKPNKFLYEALDRGGEYINVTEGFCSHKPESRLKHYYFDCFDRRSTGIKHFVLRGTEIVSRRIFRKQNYPFAKFFHGSSWWILSRACVEFIIDFVRDHPSYVDFYRSSLCPDESFIQTIVGNSPFAEDARGNLTYTDWNAQNSGPAFITPGHIPLFASGVKLDKSPFPPTEPFFARKFNDGSSEVVEIIERGK